MTVMRWYAPDDVNQEDSEQNEVDGTKKGADLQVRWYQKQRLVICNVKDTDGRARLTADEERFPITDSVSDGSCYEDT